MLAEFLSEFATHLLGCGITVSEFRVAAQSAFVHAALSTARLQNSRVNQSAVAAVTGLSRTQVRALLRNPPASPPINARINAVISGWRTDPEFTDRDGKPLPLSVNNGRNTFLELVKKYGRDVSHRAILSEMRRLGFVRQGNGSVQLKKIGTGSKQSEMTRLLAQGLTHLIRKTAADSSGVLNVITGEAKTEVSDDASRLLLHRRLVQGTKAFAADIQAASDASASRRKKKSSAREVSTRILVVTVG